MDIEKLIEKANHLGMELKRDGGEFEYSIGKKFLEYATALSTLQAENAQLRGELEYEREHANAYHEECGQWEAENEKLRAELEQVKRENDALWIYIEIVDREYQRYMDRGYIDRLDELKRTWRRGQKEG